jgi:hypothetical protein
MRKAIYFIRKKVFRSFWNFLLRKITRNQTKSIILACVTLIIFFQFFNVNDFQNVANPLVIEVSGALLILLIIEYFILKISRKSTYPETKSVLFRHLISALSNLVMKRSEC